MTNLRHRCDSTFACSLSLLVAALLAVVVLPGCAKPLESQVQGIVTLDGKPLTKGTIAFHPVSSGVPAYGSIDPEGHYELKTGQGTGIQPGQYIVCVTVTDEPEEPTNPNVAPRPPKLLSPRKYANKQTSDLQFTVAPGAQQIDVPLVSK